MGGNTGAGGSVSARGGRGRVFANAAAGSLSARTQPGQRGGGGGGGGGFAQEAPQGRAAPNQFPLHAQRGGGDPRASGGGGNPTWHPDPNAPPSPTGRRRRFLEHANAAGGQGAGGAGGAGNPGAPAPQYGMTSAYGGGMENEKGKRAVAGAGQSFGGGATSFNIFSHDTHQKSPDRGPGGGAGGGAGAGGFAPQYAGQVNQQGLQQQYQQQQYQAYGQGSVDLHGTGRASSNVTQAPGGASSLSLGHQEHVAGPSYGVSVQQNGGGAYGGQNYGYTGSGFEGGYGAGQGGGGAVSYIGTDTGRSSTRVAAPPGGRSNFTFG